MQGALKTPVKVLPIELEPATYAKDARLQNEVIISVTAEGDRYLNDGKTYSQVKVDRGRLMEYLHKLSIESSDTPIRLDVDRHTEFYHVSDLMNNMELYRLRKVMFQSRSDAVDEGG